MSKTSLPDASGEVKPEPPPHPIIVMLRMHEHACADRDRVAAARLVNLCRTLEGTEAANAA